MRKQFASSVFLTFALSLFSLFGYAEQANVTPTPVKNGDNIHAEIQVSRKQALADVLKEADDLGVEIRSNEEAEEYLNYAARMSGIEPDQMHAATLGDDLIMVRAIHKNNPRILREELLHTQQQKAGIAVNNESVTHAEIEVRMQMIQNRYKWGITEDEVQEMLNDIRLIEKRGGY
ncbi:hypothetical protein [Oceanospirillum sediminis]|uniref:SurA N-terminal domain-containing protein n=1 Tax=Oceanospirillum sediminis TaxID=2760088 RepID=A0A839IQC4_9GAMM|nr:hypothetical protein [Oceanospirillum sediminis]MBB1487131.1 hypothetical protein [Oceanospirillum sediminis]